MKFISHGAAREVTGSCHELRIATASGTKRILLDCGLFQGHRREAAEKNITFTFDPAKDIDAMILSHAHMDHVGRIPLLWKRGYRGKIFCTYATKDLSDVMLQDAAYIQEKDEEYFQKALRDSMVKDIGPLFTQKDATASMELFEGVNYGDRFPVCEGVKALFLDAGHIIGAAMVVLEVQEGGGTTRRFGFSGDLGRSRLPIIRDPSSMPSVEALICESTYGNREHEDIATARDHLRDAVIRTAKRGGKVLIPAFSLERTQEIIYDLHVLWDEKTIPAIPIVVDSPLASRVTEVFMKHPEAYDKSMVDRFLAKGHNPFQFSLVRFTASVEESKALNATPGPMIIMAGSGMCEAGRIRHHLKNEIENPANTVLAVGYMAENTLGRSIVDPKVSEIRIFDRTLRKRAEVVSVNAYSAHADMNDLDHYILETEGLKRLILVHGEPDQMEPLKLRMEHARGEMKVVIPEREKMVEL